MPYGPQVLWPDHCVRARPAPRSTPASRDRRRPILRKGFRREMDSYSAFFENDHTTPTGLDGYLRDRAIDSVVIVGLATDFCVNYSALDAARLGFAVTVREGLTRAIDLDGQPRRRPDAHARGRRRADRLRGCRSGAAA